MSFPSFSSFPVFESFPDLEPGPSSRQKDESKTESTKHTTNKERRSKSNKRREGDDSVVEKGKGKRKGIDRDEREGKRKKKRKRHSKHHHDSDSDFMVSQRLGESKVQEELNSEYYSNTLETPHHIFFEDSKGDPLNITYGSLHSGKVPKYDPFYCGKQVLGVRKGLIALYRNDKGIEIGRPTWIFIKSPLTEKRTRKRLASKKRIRLVPTSKTLSMYEEIDGFIRVKEHSQKEDDQSYRAISKEGRKDDSDSDSAPSEDENDGSGYGSDSSPMSAREEYIRSLEQALSREPTVISNWLQLLEHTISDIPASSKNAAIVRSEMIVSVLARALEAHPHNSSSVLLRLKYLKAGESIWSKERLDEEWGKALQASKSSDLRVEWLDWKIRNTSGVGDLLDDASYTLQNIGNELLEEDAELARLRIFWRITIFLQQAGFVERAFSLFQAQAELSFNIAERDEVKSLKERLDLLEEFWDSEVRRMGESGAKGWKNWQLTKESNDNPEGPRKLAGIDSQNPYDIWIHNEMESDRCLFLPNRIDYADDEDPYTVILFSDIRPFLFHLSTQKGKNMFRMVWLAFMGLHIPGLSSALSTSEVVWDDRWADTTLMQPRVLRSLFPPKHTLLKVTTDSVAGTLVGKERTYKPSFDLPRSWCLDAVEPLEGFGKEEQFRNWSKGYASQLDRNALITISNIFDQMQLGNDKHDWLTKHLAFEASGVNLQSALKRSQALLSSESSSPVLLAAHASLERMNKKFDKAVKVYRVGLTSLSQTKDPNVVYLWWGLAELQWLRLRDDAALEAILRSAGQSTERTGVNILRTKGQLEDFCKDYRITWEARHRWIKLRILLELLTGPLDSAIEVAERLQSTEAIGGVQHEALMMSILVMVYHHTVTLSNPAPPRILRELVHKALELYPDNSIILGCFLECEKGEGVWGRVRNLLSEGISGKSLARRLMEVWIAGWDEGRWLSEVERVREKLETAVTSDRTKGSAILWIIYIRFEIAADELKKAKRVLYRALGECPMVKGLYLLAFEEEFRTEFSKRELLTLYETMLERGLRLRKSLSEVLEEYGGMDRDHDVADVERRDVENDIDVDEQMYASRELRRLMPY